MQAVTTIGFDIAKSVFQVHGVDTVGQVLIRRQLKHRQVIAFFQKLPACLVGIEACGRTMMTTLKIMAAAAGLLVGGTSLAMAQYGGWYPGYGYGYGYAAAPLYDYAAPG